MNISKEQQAIIEAVREDKNVIVDAVAGSGKTTTISFIAKDNLTKNILILTYNTKLKIETRQRFEKLNLENCEIQTYHSFGHNHYNTDCSTDRGLILINEGEISQKDVFRYDMIILDEVQDMTEVFFEFVCKIIKDNKKIPQICILGDENQSVYAFKEADPRYILYPDLLLDYKKREWVKLTLSISFRITIPISNFLNEKMLHVNRVKAIKEGEAIDYIIYNGFKHQEIIKQKIWSLCQVHSPGDIFILAPSVKLKELKSNNTQFHLSPLNQIANAMTSLDIPIYIPDNDSETMDEKELKNKLVFSTFHQAKGLERDVVIIYNFDNSYFEFYDRESNSKKCPNTMYVAVTRAKKKLILLHHYKCNFLPFLDIKKLKKFVNIINLTKKPISIEIKNKSKKNIRIFSPTSLLSYKPSRLIFKIMNLIEIIKLQDKESLIEIESKVKRKNYTFDCNYIENISKYNGIAIPSYSQYLLTGNMDIYNLINDGSLLEIDKYKEPDKLLELVSLYDNKKTGVNFKRIQSRRYDWLTQDILDKSHYRIIKHINERCQFEKGFKRGVIKGVLDCLDEGNKTIWEFKFVNDIKSEHFIQLAIYKYITNFKNYKYKLFNIKTNELFEIKVSISNLDIIIDLLMKDINNKKKSDEEFINDNINIFNKYNNPELFKRFIDESKPLDDYFKDFNL